MKMKTKPSVSWAQLSPHTHFGGWDSKQVEGLFLVMQKNLDSPENKVQMLQMLHFGSYNL